MLSQRYRPVAFAVAILVVVWSLAVGGYQLAGQLKAMPEAVSAYAASVDFGKLSGVVRDQARHRLEALIGDLTLEERQQVWPDIFKTWVAAMNPREKSQFFAATAMTGFKQTISEFDQLPPEQREQAVADRLKKLQAAREQEDAVPAAGKHP